MASSCTGVAAAAHEVSWHSRTRSTTCPLRPEGSRRQGAAAVATRAPDAAELASIAKAYIGDRGSELLQDCVQLHGGIGVTFDHDLHMFLRRVSLNRALLGTPAEHRQRVATLFERLDATA